MSALFYEGRYAEVEPLARSLTARFPLQGDGWKILGATLKQLGRTTEAMSALQQAAILLPGDAGLHNNLGNILNQLGQYGEAEACFRRALLIKPDFAEAHYNLGIVVKALGQYGEAEACFRRALLIKPDFAEACYNLGNSLHDLGRLSEAEACFRQALRTRPHWPEASCNLGNTLAALGRLAEAEACCREALQCKPDYLDPYSSLLFLHSYSPEHTAADYLEEARRYGQRADSKVGAPFAQWICDRRPQRLRVGLVSGDFRNHPVGYFLEGLLAQLDPSSIELFAYPTILASDELTARIRPYFAAWKPIFGLSDEAAANSIHEDGVHLLIDLAGHTANNRLPVFAWKPAPVQLSWLGYFASTGVAAMDYFLADPWTLPESLEAHFTEKVWRLPETRLCFTAPKEEVDVAPLPALANGYVTFGCFNNLTKLNDAVVTQWARILESLPGSRLLLKAKQLKDATLRQAMTERFAAHGIGVGRLILEGPSPRGEYLAAYARVDIALDPFPFTGGTTTAEALWMGVPVLTLAGDRFISRQGAGLLANASLQDWISGDIEDYVRRAVAHAGDLDRLSRLRQALRQQLLSSPLFDAQRFARHFESAMRGIWEQWSVPQGAGASATALQCSPDIVEIICATRLSEQEFWQRSALGISLQRLRHDHRLVAKIRFENRRGLPEIYNERIASAGGADLLIFVHDDVWLDDCFLADRVREGLAVFDVIGVAGNRRRAPGQPAWIFADERLTRDSRDNLSGAVAHGHASCGAVVFYGPAPAECELLDGVLLAVRKSILSASSARFDPQFDFHFYDLDFCRSARQSGLRLGTWPIAITHQSNGSFGSDKWQALYRAYLEKWKE